MKNVEQKWESSSQTPTWNLCVPHRDQQSVFIVSILHKGPFVNLMQSKWCFQVTEGEHVWKFLLWNEGYLSTARSMYLACMINKAWEDQAALRREKLLVSRLGFVSTVGRRWEYIHTSTAFVILLPLEEGEALPEKKRWSRLKHLSLVWHLYSFSDRSFK